MDLLRNDKIKHDSLNQDIFTPNSSVMKTHNLESIITFEDTSKRNNMGSRMVQGKPEISIITYNNDMETG